VAGSLADLGSKKVTSGAFSHNVQAYLIAFLLNSKTSPLVG
jgi:hypothetical protein